MMGLNSHRRIHFRICALVHSIVFIFVLNQIASAQADRDSPRGVNNSGPGTSVGRLPPAIVIGFVGGFVRHDNLVHSEVQLAARLRKAYPAGVVVETYESYNGENARKKIWNLLDANH